MEAKCVLCGREENLLLFMNDSFICEDCNEAAEGIDN